MSPTYQYFFVIQVEYTDERGEEKETTLMRKDEDSAYCLLAWVDRGDAEKFAEEYRQSQDNVRLCRVEKKDSVFFDELKNEYKKYRKSLVLKVLDDV